MESFTQYCEREVNATAAVVNDPFSRMAEDFFFVRNLFEPEGGKEEYRIYQRLRTVTLEDASHREVARCWSAPVALEITNLLNRKTSN